MFKATQKTLRTLIFFFAGFFLLAALLLVIFWFGIRIEKDHESGLAFWVQHDFATGTANIEELIENLSGLPVTDLYFHAGPLQEDGTLPEGLNIPSDLFTALPSTDYAWLGQIRSRIDLDNPVVREAIVDSSKWLLAQGFEGIHLNIEPVREEDEGYFALLEELRTALPDTSLSITMDEWQPHGLTQLIAQQLEVPIESYWSTEQVQRVLPFIDQLVVMTYDTGFKDAKLYSWWVEQQSIALSNRVSADVELFIGIPCYSEGASFDPLAENITSGLAGYRHGVDNFRGEEERITGLAVYSYWEMDGQEWETLNAYFKNDETDLRE